MACRSQISEVREKVKRLSESENIEMHHLDLSKIDSIHRFVDKHAEDNITLDVPFPIRVILRGIFSVIFRSPAKAAPPVIYMAASDDFIDKTNQYLHMFIPKRMDEKVYVEQESKKLWEESVKLWKESDKKAAV